MEDSWVRGLTEEEHRGKFKNSLNPGGSKLLNPIASSIP